MTDEVVITEGDNGEAVYAKAEYRTVLVHLNVEVPAVDGRDANEIADALMVAIEVGSDHDLVRGLRIRIALAEDV
jgi:hypothetical protein